MFNFSSRFRLPYCIDVVEQGSISKWLKVSLQSACQKGLFLRVHKQYCLYRVLASHHATARAQSWLERAHSWPVRMAGDGQGAVPASEHCTSAWHITGVAQGPYCSPAPAGSAPSPQLPAAHGTWLAAPGHLNILVGNL